MKKTIIIIVGTVTVLLTSMLDGVLVNRSAAIVRGVQAQEEEGCSAATLQGEYLFDGRGEAPAYAHAPGLPMVFAGVRTFDGEGNLSQVETISLGGSIRRLQEEGVYTLGADCTGSMTIVGVRTFDIFVSKDGSEGVAIRTTDGSVGTQTFKKR